MKSRVVLDITDFSGELFASNFRAKRICQLGTRLAVHCGSVCQLLPTDSFRSEYISNMFPETSVLSRPHGKTFQNKAFSNQYIL
jgi:hypothetical protein